MGALNLRLETRTGAAPGRARSRTAKAADHKDAGSEQERGGQGRLRDEGVDLDGTHSGKFAGRAAITRDPSQDVHARVGERADRRRNAIGVLDELAAAAARDGGIDVDPDVESESTAEIGTSGCPVPRLEDAPISSEEWASDVVGIGDQTLPLPHVGREVVDEGGALVIGRRKIEDLLAGGARGAVRQLCGL